jgi:TP901 family phage tail tape measure protein
MADDKIHIDFTGDASSFNRAVNEVEGGVNRASGGFNVASVAASAFGFAIGQAMFTAAGAVADFAAGAVSDFVAVDTALTNIQSVTMQTDAEIASLGRTINTLASGSILADAQVQIAQSAYEVASGVADESARIDILTESLSLAEAGAMEMQTATAGLVGAVNAYTPAVLSADRAADIYQRTVAVGVGSADEFTRALNSVVGTVASAGVGFDELGSAIAFQTTKGVEASVAARNTRTALLELIAPGEKMKDLYEDLGVTSGQWLVETRGLAGAIDYVSDAVNNNTGALFDLTGSQEALAAMTAISTDEYEGFFTTFQEGVDGSVDAARAIQAQGIDAQWQNFNNQISTLANTFITELEPAISSTLSGLADAAQAAGGFIDFIFGDDPVSDIANTIDETIPDSLNGLSVEQPITANFTLANGETLWQVWTEEFSDSISWDDFKQQTVTQLEAAGFTATTTPAGFAFTVQADGEIRTNAHLIAEIKSERFLEMSRDIDQLGQSAERAESPIYKLGTVIGEAFESFASGEFSVMLVEGIAGGIYTIGAAAREAAIEISHLTEGVLGLEENAIDDFFFPEIASESTPNKSLQVPQRNASGFIVGFGEQEGGRSIDFTSVNYDSSIPGNVVGFLRDGTPVEASVTVTIPEGERGKLFTAFGANEEGTIPLSANIASTLDKSVDIDIAKLDDGLDKATRDRNVTITVDVLAHVSKRAGDAATSAVIGDIPQFADGGYTGSWSGPGLDGQGGFIAMLHPNETVIPSGGGQAQAEMITIHMPVTLDGQVLYDGMMEVKRGR